MFMLAIVCALILCASILRHAKTSLVFKFVFLKLDKLVGNMKIHTRASNQMQSTTVSRSSMRSLRAGKPVRNARNGIPFSIAAA